MRSLLLLAVLLTVPAALHAAEDERPWSEQPFLGLGVRDIMGYTVIAFLWSGLLFAAGLLLL